MHDKVFEARADARMDVAAVDVFRIFRVEMEKTKFCGSASKVVVVPLERRVSGDRGMEGDEGKAIMWRGR